jgi:hypothetical protein
VGGTATGVAAGTTAGSLLNTAVAGLTNPQTLANLTLLAATSDPDISGLTAEEQQLFELRKAELERMAVENRDLFEQQVAAAQRFMDMAEQQAPDPEQAFAETKIRAERQLAEETRGMSGERAEAARRRSRIRSAEAGAVAAAAEEERGGAAQQRLMQAGLSNLPTAVPEGYAGLALPMYEDLAERRRQAQADLVYGTRRALQPTGMFGGIT